MDPGRGREASCGPGGWHAAGAVWLVCAGEGWHPAEVAQAVTRAAPRGRPRRTCLRQAVM